MNELHGEKIDIVDCSDDPAELVGARAVARPGSAASRSSTSAARSARVVVPDFQLSLAIGKEGQNARLAARLTGWRIDIRSDEAPAEPADRAGRVPVAPPLERAGTRQPVRLRAAQRLDCTAVRDSATHPRMPVQSLSPTRPEAGPHLRGMSAAGRETRVAASRRRRPGSTASRSSPIRRDGHPAGARTCTPPPSASSSPLRRRAFARALDRCRVGSPRRRSRSSSVARTRSSSTDQQ